MRDIDDKMIEKALWNLKWMRRLKPCFAVLGLIMLVIAGILGRSVYLFAQRPLPQDSSGLAVFHLIVLTVHVGFALFMGVFLLCSGLFRNNKDIILEHLAEQYLKEKKEQER